MQPNTKSLLIEGCFYRVWFFEMINLDVGRWVFKAIKAMDKTEKLPVEGAISKAMNPIAGRLLSSRAYFLFRFISANL